MPYFEPPPAAGGGGLVNRQFHEIIEGEILTPCVSVSRVTNRPFYIPFWLEGDNLSCKTIRFYASIITGPPVLTLGIGLYKLSGTELALQASATQSYNGVSTGFGSGMRAWDFVGLSNYALSNGQWWMAFNFSATVSTAASMVLYGGQSKAQFNGFVSAGTNSTFATNDNSHIVPWWGVHNTTLTTYFLDTVNRTNVIANNSSRELDLYVFIGEI